MMLVIMKAPAFEEMNFWKIEASVQKCLGHALCVLGSPGLPLAQSKVTAERKGFGRITK